MYAVFRHRYESCYAVCKIWVFNLLNWKHDRVANETRMYSVGSIEAIQVAQCMVFRQSPKVQQGSINKLGP